MARDLRDDSLHPVLSKVRPAAQTRLHEPTPGRQRYGAARVQEVTPRSALTDFHMGHEGGRPAWSLNPYVGCQHACTYCYVPDTIHAERWKWGTYVVTKPGIARRLAQEMKRRPRATVYISTATDPYQPLEQEQEATRQCLEVLARADWPVDILTRSPLVLRDLDVLGRFTQVRVGMSIPTLDDGLRRLIEPAAPPIAARLDTLRRLHEEGIETYGNYCPAYPPTKGISPRDIAGAFAATGVVWVNSNPMTYLRDVLPALRAKLPPDQWEWLERIADRRRQDAFHQALRRAMEIEGIHVHKSFFKPPFEPAGDEASFVQTPCEPARR